MKKEMTVEQKQSLHVEILEKCGMFLTAAFGFVVGLAWNTAVQDLVGAIFPKGNTLGAEFTYAIAITVIVAVITFYFGRAVGMMKEKMK